MNPSLRTALMLIMMLSMTAACSHGRSISGPQKPVPGAPTETDQASVTVTVKVLK